jgi:ankyrin repeat protein
MLFHERGAAVSFVLKAGRSLHVDQRPPSTLVIIPFKHWRVKMKSKLLSASLLAVLCLPLFAEDFAGLFEIVRRGDLRALKSALRKPDAAKTKDSKGVTVLMYAVAFGSPEAVRMLIDAGADVNAKNSFDATALLWAAGDAAKARMLMEHGADVNARSKQGRTPLIAAAAHDGNSETVRLLLEKGADARAQDALGAGALHTAAAAGDMESVRLLLDKGVDASIADKGGNTPLAMAAGSNNPALVKLLLEKGAKVNAANTFAGTVKFGPIALVHMTPLMFSVPNGTPELVKMLLDAGANVNEKDVRGMTPLMLSVSSDAQNVEIVKLLIAAKADVNARSAAGETALDWALKYNNPAILETLRKAFATQLAVYEAPKRKPADAVAPARAVEKSLALLQKSSSEFFKQSGCVGCHHQTSTSFAVNAARAAGFRVDEAAAREQSDHMRFGLREFQEGLLQRLDGPAGPDISTATLLGMANSGHKPDLNSDTAVCNIAAQQRADGSWVLRGVSRTPMEESNIARTTWAVRVLKLWGPPARKPEFDKRIARARAWLVESKPRTTDDLALRLLGLAWTAAGKAEVQTAARALMAQQRPDGGWAATPNLQSDALATGESLYALRETASIGVADDVYQRGVRFLLSTQFEDGSWYVRSRAPKFQPYFQSGFPFDHDQWISSTATAWATVALAPAAKQQTASR